MLLRAILLIILRSLLLRFISVFILLRVLHIRRILLIRLIIMWLILRFLRRMFYYSASQSHCSSYA